MPRQVPHAAALAAFVFLVIPAALLAQPAEPPTPGADSVPANESSDDSTLRPAFDAAFAAYRQQLVAIEELRTEYQEADDSRRAAINQELFDRRSQTQELLDRMVAAALAVYEAAPESDRQITELLYAVARHRLAGSPPSSQGGDDFEAALEVIVPLIQGGNASRPLPLWGMIAAFATNELDLAADYEQLARKNGAFGDAPNPKDEVASQLFAFAMQVAERNGRQAELWAAEQEMRAAEAAADDLPRVRLMTTEGEIVVELFENEAPQAVANFLTLVKDGHYNGLSFHRVLPQFMAQGGCPRGDGSGGPGYTIPCECYEPNARKHFRGTLSMAHAGRDTGGSQFFLTFVPTSHLDGRHTVFGRVLEGFDVLAKLTRVEPGKASVPPSQIVSAEVIRDRGHDYSQRFEKLPAR